MFLGLHLNSGKCNFELPCVTNYTHVCVVKSIVTLSESTSKGEPVEDEFGDIELTERVKQPEVLYVVADFVQQSLINDTWCGVLGVSDTQSKFYVGLNVTRTTLGIKLSDKYLNAVDLNTAEIVLHFK